MSTAPAAESPPPGTPQVLLFGHTGAGKSALLGALLRAAETQGPTLRGEVLEASGRLASIRDAVYQGSGPESNPAELTSYTVRLRPWRDGTRAVTDPVTVVLHDCSGKAAESLIQHPEALNNSADRPPVARAVVEADAIVLLVDGAADDEELQEAFEEFDTFLTIVARGKAAAREVGGMPVLLVLTQCDRLARPGETRAEWEGRVGRRADRAWKKFDAFLKDAEAEDGTPSPFLPFGSVDLSVYAVAVRLPRFGDVPAEPGAPYQVAELFRDCFTVAKARRDRAAASERRLRWTVRFALGFIGLLFVGVVTVALLQPGRAGPDLADLVRGYQDGEPEAAVRLAYPYLTRNKRVLAGFRDDRRFPALPDELQAYVLGRLEEIEDYEKFRARLLAAQAPGDARTLEDLARVEDALRRGELALPAKYAWGKTAAGELRDKWLLDDVPAIREAEKQFLARYQDYVRRGNLLTLRPSLGDTWRAEVEALVAEGEPPAGLADPLPESPALEGPRGDRVPRRVPFEFERVYNARRDWGDVRDRLLHLRDLGDALGLTAGPEERRVLVLPDPGPGVNSAALPAERLFALPRRFPGVSTDLREWEVRNFPDPARSLLADRLDRSFQTGARHVRELLRGRMGPDPARNDTPEWWRSAADALGDPATPFPEWGRLLHRLALLRDPAVANPVGELAAFLRKGEFDLGTREFSLALPRDLNFLDNVVPAGPLTVSVTPPGGAAVTREYKPVGPGEGSPPVYRLAAEGEGKLTYRPGDVLRAELPLRAGGQDYKLVWDTTRSRAFQFDKLAQDPTLVKPGGGTEPAPRARLAPVPGPAPPRLPALFPDVRK